MPVKVKSADVGYRDAAPKHLVLLSSTLELDGDDGLKVLEFLKDTDPVTLMTRIASLPALLTGDRNDAAPGSETSESEELVAIFERLELLLAARKAAALETQQSATDWFRADGSRENLRAYFGAVRTAAPATVATTAATAVTTAAPAPAPQA